MAGVGASDLVVSASDMYALKAIPGVCGAIDIHADEVAGNQVVAALQLDAVSAPASNHQSAHTAAIAAGGKSQGVAGPCRSAVKDDP